MAWTTSDRRRRLPPDWGRRVAATLQRDGHRCTWVAFEEGVKVRCPETSKLEVDHRIPNDNHDLDNLRSLCHRHHAIKTQSESWASRHRNRKRVKASFRRTEEHPAAAYMKLGGPPTGESRAG